ncbi:MAG: taurine dioxygenase [Alphaproteobacteria bacterium]|nr:taurine dioxygenase [Alphaproteobacteria bacterium]
MHYEHIEVRPIAGALGAEISGVDLAKPLDNRTFAEIHQALLDNLVIFFRDQTLTPDQHKAFGRRFGGLDIHDYVGGVDGHPEIIPVIKEAEERGKNFGGIWHSDVTYQEKPALGSVLYAHETPPYGGDTLFANQYLAYETLSDGMKAMLGGLQAVHSAVKAYGPERERGRYKSIQVAAREEAKQEMVHPVVRTHPESGRKGLFVNGVFTLRFAGWTEAESQPLLQFLYQHSVRPEFTCRFPWRDKSVAFWDNRCTQHFALNDYHGHRRAMHRVTVSGDRPF